MSTRKSNSMIKAITPLKNYPSARSGAWLREATARVISGALIFSLMTLSTPGAPQWTLVMAQETATDIRFAYHSSSFSTLSWASSVLALFAGDRKAPKITSIEIQPADATVMQGETINFAGIARSAEGAVAAVQYRWTFSREGDTEPGARGFRNGVFNANRPGRYVITATGNGIQGQTTLTVYPNEGYGVQKKLQRSESERSERDRQAMQRLTELGVLTSRTISSRDSYSAESERQRGLADEQRREMIRQKQNEARQRKPDPFSQSVNRTEESTPEENNVAQSRRRKGGPRVNDEIETVVEAPPRAPSAPPARLMDVIGWDDTNWNTADDPGNQVGNPPGSAPDSGASNGNFRLSAPVLSLGGRGLDVNLALIYNSRLWSKSGTTMTYDADDGFPAPGWSIGFGKMIYTGANGGCMLITPDGTRRSYTGSNTTYGSGTYYTNYFTGYSTDGSLIDYTCYYSNSTYGTTLSGSARLSNGTTITYSSPTGNYKQVYPTRITDSQGNFITITYVSNQGPRIDTITDTLGRVVTFNYDTGRLFTITGPGYNNTTRTYVRIDYEQKTLSYAFASGYTTSTQSNTPYLIKSIYYPDTNTGYWFGETSSYSSYGMIAKVQSRRGMSCSGSCGTSDTVSGGTANREEIYNFDMTANSALTDAPGYTQHSETWDRMDGSNAAETTYSVSTVSNTEVITVTRPDGSKSKQTSVSNTSSWDDGLYFQNEILSPSDDVLSKTKIYLASGAYGSSRPTKIETTDELEQMTKVEFTYGTSYNQVTAQKEFDYAGNLYRETRYTYENNAAYTNRHIFSLVKKVEQYDASNNRQSLTEYQYDNNAVVNGTSSHGLVAASGVVQHDATSDPYTTETEMVPGETCLVYGEPWNYYPQCQFQGQEVWGWEGSEYVIIGYCEGTCCGIL